MLRGRENALPPNWLHMPIAYNGRASTVVVSGTTIRRPCGQFRPAEADRPIFGPTRRLDFELEFGALIGTPSRLGERLDVAAAEESIFGFVLLNDWSARDIQAWEMHPLGPFQGKAFGTTISPWVVPRAALEPVRTDPPRREHPPLRYLEEPGPMHHDIVLEARILPPGADEGTVVTRTNTRHLYYSIPQMIAHHTACGCAMEPGDLVGTGTVSGPEPAAWASLLELSRGGSEEVRVGPGGRTFLEDDDSVLISGGAMLDGVRIGFGPCDGKIVAAALD
jgi:fumarylacetoacetase